MPAEISDKTRMSTLSTTIQHSFGSFGHSNQSRKIKGIQIGKEEVKLSLFLGQMMLYIENPKVFTKKPSELLNLVILENAKYIEICYIY